MRRRASTCFAFMLAKNIRCRGDHEIQRALLQSTARAKTHHVHSYNPNPKYLCTPSLGAIPESDDPPGCIVMTGDMAYDKVVFTSAFCYDSYMWLLKGSLVGVPNCIKMKKWCCSVCH